MKRLIPTLISCGALSIFGLAVPVHATTISLVSTTAGGDLTTLNPSGTSDPVLGIGSPSPDPAEVFTTLTVTGGPANGSYSSIFLNEIYSSTTDNNATADTLTVSGTITTYPVFSNLTTASTLLTIVFTSAGLTANATAGPTGTVSLNSPPTDVVSITLSSAFAADLGLPTTLSASDLSALTLLGGSNGAPGNYSSTSGSLILNAVPEPGSWFMATLGLALLVFASQRKFSRVG